jgi:uncharacterized membrane protein YcaP (DUF421 family)
MQQTSFGELIWGHGDQLTILQMSMRALIMYFIALILIRVGGMRIFGKKSAFDTIIIIMFGAVAARGIVGASPFISTVAASAVMIGINRILAWLAENYRAFNHLVRGKPLLLVESGQINWSNMQSASLSKTDLMESLHLETKEATLEKIDKAYMETNGRISFLLKKADG